MNEFKLKEFICEIGRRVYNKGFAAANDGNISVRLNGREILCTPTMGCKGFMKPDDLCKVDYEGGKGVNEAGRPVKGGLRGKAARGAPKGVGGDLFAPGGLKDPAGGAGGRPRPPAARDRLRRRARAGPQVHPAGGRGVPRRG